MKAARWLLAFVAFCGAASVAEAVQISSGETTISLKGDSTFSFYFDDYSRVVNMVANPKVEITGTITNWNAYVKSSDNSWDGLWSSIGMYGTNDNWADGVTSISPLPANPTEAQYGAWLTQFRHAGLPAYGNTIAHQVGFGQNASLEPLGLWDSASGMTSVVAKLEDFATVGTVRGVSAQTTPVALDTSSPLFFKIDYDLTNLQDKKMTGSISTDGSNWTTQTVAIGKASDGTTDEDYTKTVFAILAFNSATAAGTGTPYYNASGAGYTVSWQVSTVPEPGTTVLLATALLSIVAYAWRKRR